MNASLDRATVSLAQRQWHLEGIVGAGDSLRRIPVASFPFRVGRAPNLALSLPVNSVSKLHAELTVDRDELSVRDMGSTNGTFVNGHRIGGPTILKEGDLVHFAGAEFRVGCTVDRNPNATVQEEPGRWVWVLTQFDKLFNASGAQPHYQPIVDLRTRSVVGYEVLARSSLEGLESPALMFKTAEQLNLAGELSRLFRRLGTKQGLDLPGCPRIYLNTHPAEIGQPGLLESLTDLRISFPTAPVTLEIHEAAVTDPGAMRELHAAIRALDMQLAYDDFGAGQARLVDLAEAPPDVLKFDISLIRDIDKAACQRQNMVAQLVRMARDLGVCPLAEGIERAEEGETCALLGFDLAQGFHFGRPAPPATYCG